MAILLIAEHDNQNLKPATLNTVTAASKMASDIHVLIAGDNCSAVSEAVKKIGGVTKVIVANDPAYKNFLAENKHSPRGA